MNTHRCLRLDRGMLEYLAGDDNSNLHEPAENMGSQANGPCIGVGMLLKHIVCPHCWHPRDEGPSQPGKGLQQGVIDSIEAEANKGQIDDITPAIFRFCTQHLRGMLNVLSTQAKSNAAFEQSRAVP